MTLSNLTSNSLYKAQGGLLGLGNWATITATTGSPSTGTYTDANGVAWKYYQWNSAGSVTTTAGLVDALLIGAGTWWGNTYGGMPGTLLTGVRALPAATHSITVPVGTTNGTNANAATLGPLTTGGTTLAYDAQVAAQMPGVSSSITGTALTYGRAHVASPRANSGDGGAFVAAAAGVVIIRVPSAFAQA